MSDNGTKKKHQRIGMGFIPFFNDFSVYRGIKILAGQRKMKTMTLILEVLQKHYSSLMGQELDITTAENFHNQIAEASKKQKTRDVPDFIEYCCSKFLEKAVEQMKPQVKRG